MQPNYRKIATIAAVYVLAIAGIVWLLSQNQPADTPPPSNDNATEQQPVELPNMASEYPEVPVDNRYVRESATETIQRYRQGSNVIFLGFKECPWCQQMAPMLNEAAEAEEVDVHYLDIRQERENNTPHYRELLSILSPHLAGDGSGNPVISVPDISFVKDGEIVWRYKMDPVSDYERTPTAYWTPVRRAAAMQQFRDQMQNLK